MKEVPYTIRPAIECFSRTPVPDEWSFDLEHAIRILETLGYTVIRPEEGEES